MLISLVILQYILHLPSLIANMCFPPTDTSSSEVSSEVDSDRLVALQESGKQKKTQMPEQAGILTVCLCVHVTVEQFVMNLLSICLINW